MELRKSFDRGHNCKFPFGVSGEKLSINLRGKKLTPNFSIAYFSLPSQNRKDL